MKSPHRYRWAYAWLAAAVALAGCKDDSSGVIGATCFPECRAGTVCSPSSTCVSACNPVCGAGEACTGSGTSARCVANVADAGSDGGTLTDATTSTDATTDSGTTPSDAAESDAFVPPMNCGMSGQPCCVGRGCYGGGYCAGGTCAAPAVREPSECNRAADCTGGQTCGGIYTCSGGADGGVDDGGSAVQTRGCFLCGTSPGAAAFGAACPNGSACASGLCSGGHCTEACAVGSDGDTACAAHGANVRCLNLFFTQSSTAPLTTLGICGQTCARDADCGSDSACVPRLNYFADRMDFACAVPSATLTGHAGDTCDPSSSGTTTCRNVLCVAVTAGAGYCTAPCATDADCPAAAPLCGDLYVTRPSGAIQASLGCRPRPT